MGEEIKDTIKTMVIKRNGSSEPFSSNKIEKAILRAMRNSGVYKPKLAKLSASDAEDKFMKKSLFQGYSFNFGCRYKLCLCDFFAVKVK